MVGGAGFTSGCNESFWLDGQQQPAFASLSTDTVADVCVIGAGISGLTVAYQLMRDGLSVVVLEDGLVGSGETGRTTAHLSNALDDRYTEVERIHGQQGARLAAESHAAAIDRIEQIAREERIGCDFRRVDGYLILSPEQAEDVLIEEQAAARRAGLAEVEFLDRPPLDRVTRPCLRFPRQAQFHPLQYLRGLTDAVVKRGGRIFTQTHVAGIEGGARARVSTASGLTVEAGSVVVATNSPINDLVSMHTKQAPYRTYVNGVPIPKDSVAEGLYWDTSDPYHYVRLQRFTESEDLLIVGGEDHKTGQGDRIDRHAKLQDWMRQWFPMAKQAAFTWSGQVMESIDGLGYIGRNPGDDHVYIATGDSGMGMTHGTIAGILIGDLICGRENPWSGLYDPARLPLKAVIEFARENINMAGQYLEWIKSGDVESVDDIPAGQGAVLSQGMTRLAVYRDGQGRSHVRSAVCPHLRCIVGWNAEEQTWDCPCHGSRFDRFGKVLNGPANRDLEDAHLREAA